ncbi:hypothetical protein HY024_02565 [Candidatus Curtissbacteria bacterium]|nr:hypothetical protein [Candidatus Curtissbacteria bacterium]
MAKEQVAAGTQLCHGYKTFGHDSAGHLIVGREDRAKVQAACTQALQAMSSEDVARLSQLVAANRENSAGDLEDQIAQILMPHLLEAGLPQTEIDSSMEGAHNLASTVTQIQIGKETIAGALGKEAFESSPSDSELLAMVGEGAITRCPARAFSTIIAKSALKISAYRPSRTRDVAGKQ